MVGKLLKWAAIALGAIVALVLVLAGFVVVRSNARINRRFDVPPPALAIPTDSASLARGRHLFDIGGCTDCHTENLGGQVTIDAPPFLRVAAPNLTRGRGGVGASLTDADWVRAVRHGVGPDGRALVLMPADAYRYWSDADLAALVAYARTLPPIDNEVPARRFGPIARVMLASGRPFPLFTAELFDHAEARAVTAPPVGVTPEYGRYLGNALGCTACHGASLSGGPIVGGPPGTPPASNLTPTGLGRWTEEDFFRALREGRRPGGVAIADFMPWRAYRHLTDDEIRALWTYLRSVPPKQVGQP